MILFVYFLLNIRQKFDINSVFGNIIEEIAKFLFGIPKKQNKTYDKASVCWHFCSNWHNILLSLHKVYKQTGVGNDVKSVNIYRYSKSPKECVKNNQKNLPNKSLNGEIIKKDLCVKITG